AVSVPLSKRSVYLPTSPLIASPLNVAAPLPVVVAAAFVSVAPVGPVAITAVTVVPAWLTALPFASRSCSTGCGVNATPLCAVAGGGVLIVSCVAVPAVAVAVKITGLPVSPLAVARAVSLRAVVPRAQEVAVATPLPSVVTGVAGSTAPFAPVALNVPASPHSPYPSLSRSCSAGGGLTATPPGAGAGGGVLIVSGAAAPAVAVAVKITGLPVSPLA